MEEKLSKLKAIRWDFKGMVTFLMDCCQLALTIITLGFYYPWAKSKTIAISLEKRR
jgi:uncharacterized membrane protein YjgN (DUF898 family)